MALIMVLFGIIEFGRGLYLFNKVSYAADRAARMVLVKPETDDQALKDQILTLFEGEGPAPSVTIGAKTVDPASSVESKTISISLPFEPIIPGLLNNAFNMTVIRRVPMLP